jgi:multidrug efflux pump subunit AcrA (membrane-fusion protein)
MAYDVVNGQVVRLVAEDVSDVEAHSVELQADLDTKQDMVNLAVQEQSQAKTELVEAETVAEAKANRLEECKSTREEAEAELAKSLDSRDSFLAAVELADSQPELDETDGVSDDSDDDEAESEAVDIPINGAQG